MELRRTFLTTAAGVAGLLGACTGDTVSITEGTAGSTGGTGASTGGAGASSGPGTTGSSTTGDVGLCGNGVVEPPEVCDDGNATPLDGCEPDCTPSSGNTLWTADRDLDGANQRVEAAAVLPDGRYVAAGVTGVGANADAFFWVLAPDGTEEAFVTDDLGAAVAPGLQDDVGGLLVLEDGGVVVAGGIETDPDNDDWQVIVRRYDADLSEVWTGLWQAPAPGFTGVSDLAAGPGGTYLLAGQTPGTSDLPDGLLLLVDEGSGVVWSVTRNGDDDGHDAFYGVHYDGARIWVCGLLDRNVFSDTSKWYVAGYDPAGNLLWEDAYPGQPEVLQRAWDVVPARDGGAYVTGAIGSTQGGVADVWVVEYGPTGSREWVAVHDGDSALYDAGLALTAGKDGALFVTGFETIVGEQQNVFMGRFEPDGTPGWTRTYNGDASLGDLGTAVVVGQDGAPVFFGRHTVLGEGENAFARKVYP